MRISNLPQCKMSLDAIYPKSSLIVRSFQLETTASVQTECCVSLTKSGWSIELLKSYVIVYYR